MSPGIFQDAVPGSDISGNPSHLSENKFLQCDIKGSRFQHLDQNVGGTVRISSHPSSMFQNTSTVFPGPNPQEDDAKFS